MLQIWLVVVGIINIYTENKSRQSTLVFCWDKYHKILYNFFGNLQNLVVKKKFLWHNEVIGDNYEVYFLWV